MIMTRTRITICTSTVAIKGTRTMEKNSSIYCRYCSTSPKVEPPGFCDSMRATFRFWKFSRFIWSLIWQLGLIWTDDDGNDEINTALHWADDDILQENDLRPKAIAVTLCWQRGIHLHFGFHFVICSLSKHDIEDILLCYFTASGHASTVFLLY